MNWKCNRCKKEFEVGATVCHGCGGHVQYGADPDLLKIVFALVALALGFFLWGRLLPPIIHQDWGAAILPAALILAPAILAAILVSSLQRGRIWVVPAPHQQVTNRH